MHDRKMIKWMPFNSVINGCYLVKTIEKEKRKIAKPQLSDEQLELFENIIIDAMHNESALILYIYHGGFIKKIESLIIKIEPATKKIFLNNHTYVYFCEIVDVKVSTLN